MDIAKILDELVAIPSQSGDEKALSDYIECWFLKNSTLEPKRIGDSVTIRIHGKNSADCLIFNGHIDTVSTGELKKWATDPYRLTQQKGKLYGLGSSDMKGGIAVMMRLASHYSKIMPPCDLIFMFASEEETSSDGTATCLDKLKDDIERYGRTSAIIGEPSSLQVVLGHRGNAWAKFYFEGRGAHASRPPADHDQALLKAIGFVRSVPEKLTEWNKKYTHEFLGRPGVTVTQIHSGTESSNQVPTSAEVTLDIRTVPSLHENLFSEIESWAQDHDSRAEIIFPLPAGYCSPEENIARLAMNATNQKKPLCTQGATDQQFFTQAGIPAIIWGPGDKSSIHAPNEYVTNDSLEKAYSLYKRVINDWSAGSPIEAAKL